MAIDFQSLLLPISAESPGGVEPRETPQYEAIYAEIELLTSVSADRLPDWPKIETQAIDLFKTTSKDFLVGAWLSAAWVEKSGVEGLSAALGLFDGLIQGFWQTAFPPLKRLRGRRNALLWFTDRITAWLNNGTLPAMPQELHDTLVSRIKAIDKALAESDPEAPSLNELISLIDRLDVIAQAPAAPPPSADGGTPAPSAAAQTTSTATPAAQAPQASAGPQLSALDKVSSTDDLVTALSPVLTYLGEASQKMLELDPFNSMAIGLNRLSARGSLLSLPQAQGQTTLIAPPPLADMQSFETVCSAGNPEGIVAFCEGRLATYPFWLDLDRQAALAYGALGSKATSMREAIVEEVLNFLKRLPGVERLTFSDGTPFADDATKAWIATCQAERAGGAPSDRFGEAKQRANTASGTDGPEAGIIALQEFISNTRSGRDQFRARLVLAELAMGLKRDVDAQPFVDPLLEDCVRLNLAYWEPELALAAWSLKLRAARAVAKQLEDSPDTEKLAAIQVVIQNALQQLSTLDFAEAMRQI